MAYYKAGTISVTSGSDVVIGVGTAWVDNVRVGDMIRLPNGQQHEILARGSDTLLSIFPAYSGPSAEGQPYFVVPVPGYGKKLYDELALAVRQFGDGAEKLENVADGATKNSSDEYLLDRENHTGKQSLSTISGAGTSAAANTQTSHTDTTPGAVLTVGAFGLGGYLDMRDGTPLKASSPPSEFLGKGTVCGLVSLSQIGLGFVGTAFGVMTVNVHWNDGATWGTQRKVEALGRTFVSYVVNSETWSPWLETAARAVGAVTEGAVIERGNNANGEYVRFADGTQICTRRQTMSPANSAIGAIYCSSQIVWSFPAAFIAVPAISGYEIGGNGLSWGGLGAVAASGYLTTFCVFSATPQSADPTISLAAIGLWK